MDSTTVQVEEDGVSSLGSSWRIPRPSIHSSSASSSSTFLTVSSVSQSPRMKSLLVPALTQYQRNLLTTHSQRDVTHWGSSQSTSSGSSAGGSQLMLVEGSRLPKKDLDTSSIASSMHFTIVNGISGRPSKGCCHGSYQLPILVITMTILIFLGILGGVLLIQLRARSLRHT